MKKKLAKIVKHPLISGSAIIVGGGLIGSFFNFLFNLFVSRNLTVEDYGTFASLISIVSIALVIAGTATPMIVNFAASYFAKNDTEKLKGLYFTCTKYYLIIGTVIFLLFLIFPQQIANFFNIRNNNLIILVGFSLFIIFFGVVNTSFLQAKLAFIYSTFVALIGSITKYIFGALFIFLKFGLFGAILAYVVSFIVGYIISIIPILYIVRYKISPPKVNAKELFFYGAPSAISMLGLTSFVTVDILLVKHFFPPSLAGLYAGLSLVAKVIFFLSAPIGSVMFPLISQKKAKSEKYHNDFLAALLMVLIPSLIINIFYFLFPDFAIKFFIKKNEYLQMKNLLGIFGIYITIYSLLTIFTNFYLSIKKTRIYIPISLGLLSQIILISLFHKNFLEIIIISMTITSLILGSFIIYFIKNRSYI